VNARSAGSGRYHGFEGIVGRTLETSRPWWQPRAKSRRGPNVVVVLADDLGFSDVSCYGSEIDTPELDQLAAEGVRYARFHSTPMCTPTRAALLTGMNPHAAGAGAVDLDDAGFPGYRGRIADDVLSAAEIFRANGYATLMVGKWHLSPRSDQADGGGKDSWPLQRGFDRFYGFNEPIGQSDYHFPHRLIEDNHPVDVDVYPDGYYLTDDLTNQAIRMMRAVKAADPACPFFLHFAHAAPHSPMQAKSEDMLKYQGRYDAGWDVLRERRFARQLDLGVIPPATRLSPRPTEPGFEVPEWTSLSADDRRLFARHMEVYAAMVDNVDQNLSRLREALDELGEWENTIVIFTSDNGATGPRLRGTLNNRLGPIAFPSAGAELDYLNLIGGPRLQAHYPRGWAMLGNTPFRLQKATAYAGGHQVPFILSWPQWVQSPGSIRNQYAHVSDVLPTLIELTGVTPPEHRNGMPARPRSGASFVSSLENDNGPTRTEQYYEIWGHRAFYREGWETVTLHVRGEPFTDEEWHLYHVDDDPTELDDLSDEDPNRRAELARGFDAAAWANHVYPLRDNIQQAMVGPPTARERSVTITPGTPTLEPHTSRALVQGRSLKITVQLGTSEEAEGVLVSHGDAAGGYLIYLERGALFWYYRVGSDRVLSGGRLGAGEHQIVAELTPAEGVVCDARLSVDGRAVAAASGLPRLSYFLPWSGIDVGIDRRGPVSWELRERRGPFPFNGNLRWVRYDAGELAPDSAERRAAENRERMSMPD